MYVSIYMYIVYYVQIQYAHTCIRNISPLGPKVHFPFINMFYKLVRTLFKRQFLIVGTLLYWYFRIVHAHEGCVQRSPFIFCFVLDRLSMNNLIRNDALQSASETLL